MNTPKGMVNLKKMGLYITLVMLFLLCSCGIASEPKLTATPSAMAVTPQGAVPAQIPSSSPKEGKATKEPDETVNIAGLFSFGMNLREVIDILLANGFGSEDFYGTGFYCTLDNREHSDLDAGGYAFTFDAKDESGKLYAFWTSEASTARGFTPGEDVKRMVELYGDNFKEYELDNNEYFCEYDLGEYYLDFYTDHDTIKTWEVTTYSYEDRLEYYQS